MTENSGVTDVPAEHVESSRRPQPDRYAYRPRRVPLPTEVDWWRVLGRYGAVFVLVVMIMVFVIIEPDTFATSSNAIQILNQSAIAAVVSMGLTFVLAAGDFDLSIGYATSFCGVLVAGFIQRDGLSIPVAIVVVLTVGAVIGLANGLIVTRIGVNPLITTLGVGTIVVGVNYA